MRGIGDVSMTQNRPPKRPSLAHVGIGSNMGDAQNNCLLAVAELNMLDSTSVRKVSSWYRTEPVGFENQDWFVNGAAVLETSLSPRDLLTAMQNIENSLGRVRGRKWGPRTIDLDLLFYDDLALDEPDLIIPHPELANRRFVLEPLNEIDPGKIHPTLRKSVHELYTALHDRKGVFLIS